MPAAVQGFRFPQRRERRGMLFTERPTQPANSVRRLPRVEPVPPPPQTDAIPLQERLRLVLTPPINEVLSDPQLGLPHLPYSYQAIGIKWLLDRDSALLADEMGLGKTMQAIIAARLLWRDEALNQVLVVCPKMLVRTWIAEIDKWWPAAHPNTCEITENRRFYLRLGTPNVTIKIINYEALARELDWLKEQRWSHDLIIIDEAQRIKNPESQTAQAVKALRAKRRWALTGTPLENRVGDVVSILDFVRPGLLESQDVDYVRERIRPFFIRRRTEDVMKDLPEKDDRDVEVELGHGQRTVYDRAEREGVIELNNKGDTITVHHVFALIQKLMQLCNFEPRNGNSAKLERISEDLEEIIASGRKALIFSRFVSPEFGLQRLKRQLPRFCHVVEIHGQIPPRQRQAGIEEFARDPSLNTMLLNYSVGGLGLNLQAANYVFLFDRWWNPAVEDQAVKRAHRIGQNSKVFVRRLYCKDTIEERILEKLCQKRRLFAHVIDDDRPTPEAMGLTEEEVFSFFDNLAVRPKRKRRSAGPPRLVLANMEPYEFEALVARVYEAQGYRVDHRGGSHDAGIDILAERDAGPGRERVAIQCKHTTRNVGSPEMQKLWGVVSDGQTLSRGDLVTSAQFTREAREFAAQKRLTLIGGAELSELAARHGVAEFVEAPVTDV